MRQLERHSTIRNPQDCFGPGKGSDSSPESICGEPKTAHHLKPTRNRVPNLPDGFDYATGFCVDHVVTRSVRDSAAMLDATGLPEPGSPYAIPAKAGFPVAL